MSENWVEPSIPSSFWMRQVSCKCMSCGTEYECDLASGNEIIKFSEDGGGEVKWLPVFERGGYMELLEKLVPDYSRKDKITMSVARIFDREFKKIQELSASGNTFSVAVGCPCPNCLAKKSETVSEKIVNSPSVSWIRYKE